MFFYEASHYILNTSSLYAESVASLNAAIQTAIYGFRNIFSLFQLEFHDGAYCSTTESLSSWSAVSCFLYKQVGDSNGGNKKLI